MGAEWIIEAMEIVETVPVPAPAPNMKDKQRYRTDDNAPDKRNMANGICTDPQITWGFY